MASYRIHSHLLTGKDKPGGDVEIILHFIPESVAAFVGKKFNAVQAEVKEKDNTKSRLKND